MDTWIQLIQRRKELYSGEEALRKINETYSASGLGLSTARSSFITRANEKVISGASLQPAKTYYRLDSANFTAALGTTSGEEVGNGDAYGYALGLFPVATLSSGTLSSTETAHTFEYAPVNQKKSPVIPEIFSTHLQQANV